MTTLAVRTVLEFQTAGREAACVLHFQSSGAFPIPLFQLAEFVVQAWDDDMRKHLSQECVLTGVQTSYLDGSGLSSASAGIAGLVSGQMLPPNNAFLLRHSVTGSSRGGRTFLPGVPVAAVFNNGVVDEPYIANISADWSGAMALIEDQIAEAPVQVILTKTGTKTVQATSVGPVIVSQRRRMD